MKTFGTILAIIFVLGAGYFWLSAQENDPGKPENLALSQQHQLAYASIEKQVAKGKAIIYDVRTPEEFAAGNFTGAINYSLQDLAAGDLPQFAKNTPLYIYCRSGDRATEATSILKKAGFTNVTNLGGLEDVEAIGGTFTKEGGAQ